MLRFWQAECSDDAFEKYSNRQNHFFCQATPGAGKTVLAANIASRLLESNMIDLVLCFSPSLAVAEGIKKTFSNTLKCSFSGELGSIGRSLTYQSIQFLDEGFWETLSKYRVFVVFDEIHHCSGSEVGSANVWGQQILTKIQGLATYTLAMSGTPWRSDSLPIVLAEYSDPDGELVVDYQYTLKQAIADKVCRSPKIVLVDNEHLTVTNDDEKQSFSSILEMLEQTKTSYQSILHNQEAMEHLLGLGCKKLEELRRIKSDAGGLVVASSVAHAHKIKRILAKKYAQTVSIVTYRHEEPLAEIERFRSSDTEWIVSVGMISEGTDIPRLQVCCHMSAVKTELYFRQVLGRILRANGIAPQYAWLFTFAEQSLIEFSEQIEQDIPTSCMFASVKMPIAQDLITAVKIAETKITQQTEDFADQRVMWDPKTKDGSTQVLDYTLDEIRLGSFKQRVIAAFTAREQ
ncbi:DEAD/DEAH box helicase family protein [Vibrio astriarenae]|uniref:DEAD/DEAH box helicase family protein n=1 Tax=Vibrio astriarenae TaxID=1481923 RepID=A0A7Z2T7N2_9VIBR|nr:DEAD/DEAH box helicase family protein [Vibrio astriarenae]QIA65722.1 DEAD/DEAH box helicase family protein [Vibrio astriarenae]